MVYTPVGIRCPDCGRQQRSGAFAPSLADLGKAAAAGAAVALVLGAVWGLFPDYGFWMSLILGFAGGEFVSLAANRRRGPELQAVAAAMVVACFSLAFVISAARSGGIQSALLFHTLMAGLAMVLATVRQR